MTTRRERKVAQCPDMSTGKRIETNRLRRRSVRQTQQLPPLDSPNQNHNVFKTPTRVTRSRYTRGSNEESSHNDSDIQQDIVWDATSPSPVRDGKRGKKYTATGGIVNISDIVNRIAPKHGRPVVSESSLQQWIGDSAILCTPEVQQPKPKKRSPRLTGVDDLMKLAKQFDLNMFRQDEEHVQIQEQGWELISDDLFHCDDEENKPTLLSSDGGPDREQPAIEITGVRESTALLPPDQDMEDDLDFLFDGPTQHISGNLSQSSLSRSLENKTVQPATAKRIPGKDTNPTHSPAPPIMSSSLVKDVSVQGDFDDDWANDDFLEDSLVFEMTQDPHGFAPPKHSSTQRETNKRNAGNSYPSTVASKGHQRLQQEKGDIQPAVSKNHNNSMKSRKTFKLEANPNFPVNLLKEAAPKKESASDFVKPGKYKETQKTSFTNVVSIVAAPQDKPTLQHHSNANTRLQVTARQVPLIHQSTWNPTSSSTSTSASTCPAKPPQTTSGSYQKTKEKEAEDIAAFRSDNCIPDDDLDSLFASDDVWDDKDGDDDLLCGVCEDLESQVQGSTEPSAKWSQPAIQKPQQRPAPVPPSCSSSNRNKQNQPAQTNPIAVTNPLSAPGNEKTYMYPLSRVSSKVSGYSSVNDSLGKAASDTFKLQNHTVTEPYRCTQLESTYSVGSTTDHQGLGNGICTVFPGKPAANCSQFTFKRPSGSVSCPVTTSTSSKVVLSSLLDKTKKCSMAEIEQKKQQAMARRRQRMQANQNQGAPP